MIEIVPAHIDHIASMADHLLDEKRICKLFPLWTTAEIMRYNLKTSTEAFTLFRKGEAACMFGFQEPDLISRSAKPWVIVTDVVKNISLAERITYCRISRKYLQDYMKKYSLIYGEVYHDFGESKAWLKWLGFSLDDKGAETIPFAMEASHAGH